jgi:hypothetical protein
MMNGPQRQIAFEVFKGFLHLALQRHLPLAPGAEAV